MRVHISPLGFVWERRGFRPDPHGASRRRRNSRRGLFVHLDETRMGKIPAQSSIFPGGEKSPHRDVFFFSHSAPRRVSSLVNIATASPPFLSADSFSSYSGGCAQLVFSSPSSSFTLSSLAFRVFQPNFFLIDPCRPGRQRGRGEEIRPGSSRRRRSAAVPGHSRCGHAMSR